MEEKLKDKSSPLQKTWKSITQSVPIILGILSLVALIVTLVPPRLFGRLFTGNALIDPFIGSALGSIFSGNPLTSYIIGGELQKTGISEIAIVAFMIAWVTVGLVQLPAEALMIGKKFAVVRNITAFFSSVIIALLTVIILGAL